MWVCLFDPETDAETARVPLERSPQGVFVATVPGVGAGARYGVRADGPWDPDAGLWFDPAKLLVDPYATEVDRPFVYDARLGHPRSDAPDTAPLMPKGVVAASPAPVASPAPLFRAGGLIYETPVRPFTMRHPDVPPEVRGTVAALAHPVIVEHLTRLGVAAVELMPVTAWIDERHLGPLGLVNGWGYNPVAMMALDPRLCPGGIGELRATTAALRGAGIGVILDVVFNHTGESDMDGPTLSLRGLDGRAYFRREADGRLANHSGTGNTLDCDHPMTRRLVLDTLRHFVGQAGVDGFRFDLAPVLGRGAHGFEPDAPLIREIVAEPLLADRVLIAEPWDIGPGGYQLGRFPAPFLEWNDRYRDRVRRFWRGARHALGGFATAVAGSDDVYHGVETRAVNFIAAHDGFTLADLVAFEQKHNDANGEHNRDGHGDNHSWNNGVEGPSDDPEVAGARKRDVRALLATLFASRGTIMLAAGDESGRTQSGNNNAYAQDNATTWLDWETRDRELEAWCGRVSALRRAASALSDPRLLTGAEEPDGARDVVWLTPGGDELTVADWEDPEGPALAMALAARDGRRVAVLFNRSRGALTFRLPVRLGCTWLEAHDGHVAVPARSVAFVTEAAESAATPPAP